MIAEDIPAKTQGVLAPLASHLDTLHRTLAALARANAILSLPK